MKTFVGYARTSTVEQVAGLEAQIRDLGAAGCEEIFSEQVSSVAERPQLDACLKYIRKGDVLVVTKMDRLARSVADLLRIVDLVQSKGAALRILDMDMDTSSPTGRMILTTLGAVAEFERALMLERQREGIARAKEAGKYKGRKPTARAKADEVKRMHQQHGIRPTDIAKRLEISRASVYRILGE